MITAMLSEALGEALRRGLATKEMVAEFDPALIFAIPRLAIVQYDIKYPMRAHSSNIYFVFTKSLSFVLGFVIHFRALSASDSIWNDVLFEHDSPLLKVPLLEAQQKETPISNIIVIFTSWQ